MQLKQLTHYLEQIAPPVYQESYDNSGLVVGDPFMEITNVLTALDATEAVIDEAIEKGCNVIVAHHPIVFKGLKRFNGQSYVERVVMKAIKKDIAIYAIHTNLDNMYANGVNTKIAERLSLQDTRILSPKATNKKMDIYVEKGQLQKVRNYLFAFGEVLSFEGQLEDGESVFRLSLNYPQHTESQIISHLDNKPIVRYEVSDIQNSSAAIGSGMIGELEQEMTATDFLAHLKDRMQVNVIRHTALLDQPIKKVAVCGGAGGFLLSKAISQGADIFITADYKYHEFFDADGKIIIADIGHYESEQFTIELLRDLISDKFSTFAAFSTTIVTNPVFYYT
ncbi:MAG: Nif3-like dinuclear metal center hexameric protein [Bacteroidota bacterium]